MKYHYRSTQQTASFLTVASLLLFVVYSMTLYLGSQRDIVLLVHYTESGSYNPDTSAFIALLGTIVSVIPALVLYKIFEFPVRLKAVAMLPSYIILGAMTAATPTSGTNLSHTYPLLTTITLSFIATLIFMPTIMYRDSKAEHEPLSTYLVPNVIVTCLGIFFTMLLTSSDRQLHQQLEIARTISLGNAETISDLSTHATDIHDRNSSAMMAYILSKEGRMADALFTIDALSGSQTLFPDTTSGMRMYKIPQTIYRHIGAVPASNFKSGTRRFLQKAVELNDTSAVLADYYLMSLLLDKHLDEFVHQLPRYYEINTTLPRHYREAYIMCQRMGYEVPQHLEDELMTTSYVEFSKLRNQNRDNPGKQRNACTDMYPGTYWCYYFFKHI